MPPPAQAWRGEPTTPAAPLISLAYGDQDGSALVIAVLGLGEAGTASLERITEGTRKHAVRRTAEMQAAADMLTELGVPPLMASASRALHERLAQGELARQAASGRVADTPFAK